MPNIGQIPLALTLIRALLAPLIVILAFGFANRAAFGVSLVTAFLSDVLDGIIARRLNVATANLRRLDSVADSMFYMAATLAAWHLYPHVIAEHATGLLILASLEVGRYAFDLRKFRREASYHMWSSKLWGLSLFIGFFSLLSFGVDGPAITGAIWLGVIADIEGIAISLVLRKWQADVPTIVHALRQRYPART
jgi:CDP-diacylglycerol--glycerol-3-phosphate 3-phosphatidyltransferase